MSDVGRFAREIVAKRVAIVAAVPLVYAAVAGAGVSMPWTSQQITACVGGGIGVIAAVGTVLWVRKDTTPADPALNPTDKLGRTLTPVGSDSPARPFDVGAGRV